MTHGAAVPHVAEPGGLALEDRATVELKRAVVWKGGHIGTGSNHSVKQVIEDESLRRM